MNKVMTRAQHRPAGRPPARRDTRRPAGSPPRTPSGGSSRTTSPGARPPGSPGSTPPRSRTRPADGRPAPSAAAPSRGTATPPVSGPLPRPRPTDVFADRLLLVLSGQRPVHSMLRHTAGRAYDDLARLAERGPLRTRGTRPVVRDIGWFEPRLGAVEVFARIGAGDQLRAMAFRLEQGGDLRWRCTAVELGGPRGPRTEDD
ncbi:Rv3235 family protein [Streptomyces sp. NPDC046859]|uniref:Rv3235 family protein n=1 Tax=Streptomyces sp. NPDC046859 TaxID=3155734 RepID=UPI003409C293